MNNEDYVSYELAKKLKACGFDEPCNFYYTKEDAPDGAVWFTGDPRDPQDYNHLQDDCPFAKPICSAPHIYHAQKWLREGAMLHVEAYPAMPTLKWYFYIDDLNQHVNQHDGELMTRWDEDMQEEADERLYDSYECAMSAGISAALELIEGRE